MAGPIAAVVMTAVVGLAGLGLVVGAASPASASACPTATGVTVLADFNSLGGGVQGSCVADGGGDKASDLFVAVGLELRYTTRFPGLVCRVNEMPETEPCVNAPPSDAYWGLWWNGGKGGGWVYSDLGVDGLTIPDGGYVAFAWDDVDGKEQPSFTPKAHAASPSPQPTPTQQPTSSPTRQPTRTPSATADPSSAAPSTSSSPTDEPSATATTSSSASPSESPTTPTGSATTDAGEPAAGTPSDAVDELAPVEETSSEASRADDDGLPGWLAPLVVVLLFAIAGVVVLLRRGQTRPE